jgi:hypothetical protein
MLFHVDFGPRQVPSLWPPPAAEAGRLRLERCSRLLPHDQDTGGFFVALLRKTAAVDCPAGVAMGGEVILHWHFLSLPGFSVWTRLG